MRSRLWYPAVAAAAIMLSSAAAFAQTAKTPTAQADLPSIVSLAHPANAATQLPAVAVTTAAKLQTDQAAIEADRRLREALSREDSDLVRGHGAGKGEYVDMQGRFSMVTIIVKQPDGTKSILCVDNYDAARKALDTPPPPAAAAE
jgi:hypothetical protein